MDQYTLMCSKLDELQREHKLVSDEDKVWMDVGDGIICTYVSAYPRKYKVVWLPTLEQMIGMIPESNGWVLNYVDKSINKIPYEVWVENDFEDRSFWDKDIKIAMIQALAWFKWGKEWDEEKQEWIKR